MFSKIYNRLRVIRRNRRQANALRVWEQEGRPAPPPHQFKQNTIRQYAANCSARALVETGTFRGDMVEAMKDDFDQIFTIELSQRYYEKACQRFANQDNVCLLQGDSATELGQVVKQLAGPAVFWLDGHYSAGDTARGVADTPIFQELDQILSEANFLKDHVVLVDDARCFGTDPAYPTTDDLKQFFEKRGIDCSFDIGDDIIRISKIRIREASVAA